MSLLRVFNVFRTPNADAEAPPSTDVVHDQHEILLRAERATRFSKGHCALIEVSYQPIDGNSPYIATSIHLSELPVPGSYEELEGEAIIWNYLWDGFKLTPFRPADYWTVTVGDRLEFSKQKPDQTGVF